jgi:hypothetical protein
LDRHWSQSTEATDIRLARVCALSEQALRGRYGRRV